MSKDTTPAKATPYMKKSSATVLAVVCLLAGMFLGFNASLFMNTGKKKATISVANVQPMQQAKPRVDIAALRKAAEDAPRQAEGWIQLGNAYFDVNNHAEAIKAYEKGLAIDGSNADVWVDLGVMYRRHGEPQKAVETFSRASVVDPRHETARFNKGIVLLHDLNDRAGAIATWEVLLKINPEAKTPDGKHLHDLVDAVKAGM